METENMLKNGYRLIISFINNPVDENTHYSILSEIKDIYDNFGLGALISKKFALWSDFITENNIKVDTYAISVIDRELHLFLEID